MGGILPRAPHRASPRLPRSNSFDYSGLRTLRADGTVADKPAAKAFGEVVRLYG